VGLDSRSAEEQALADKAAKTTSLWAHQILLLRGCSLKLKTNVKDLRTACRPPTRVRVARRDLDHFMAIGRSPPKSFGGAPEPV